MFHGGKSGDKLTEQRAKGYLKHMLDMMADEPPENLTDERDIKEWEDEHKNIRETLETSLVAVEKQIEKKPDLWGDGYADGVLVYDMYDCPNCGKQYELDYEQYDYCPNCGQKLDWTVLEGEEEVDE